MVYAPYTITRYCCAFAQQLLVGFYLSTSASLGVFSFRLQKECLAACTMNVYLATTAFLVLWMAKMTGKLIIYRPAFPTCMQSGCTDVTEISTERHVVGQLGM